MTAPTAQGGASLAIHGLGASVGDSAARRVVFAGLSLSIDAGEILAVFGPNGCGKTTLLRALAGLHPVDAGRVEALGADGRAARVALVPQSNRASFFGWASLRTNVALACAGSFAQLGMGLARADAVRDELGLDLDLRLRPPACSDGMLQQAGILRALCHQPEVLLADEPFASLDLDVARVLRGALREAVTRRAMVAVVVLHDLESILAIADRVLVIPGHPYASDAREGFAQAVVLHNRRRACPEAPAAASMTEVLRAVLGSEGADG